MKRPIQDSLGFTKVSMKTSKAESEKIDFFFTSHPALKKGETIKRWILEGIDREEQKNELQEQTGNLV